MGVFCDRLKLCYIAAPDCQIAQCSGALCQFSFLWSYYYGSNKSTAKETGKAHLCGLAKRKADI